MQASIALSAQYRWDFLTDGLLAIFWNVIGLIPLLVAFGERPTVAGWTLTGRLKKMYKSVPTPLLGW